MFPSNCPICSSTLDVVITTYFHLICPNGHYRFRMDPNGSYVSESTDFNDFKFHSYAIFDNPTLTTIYHNHFPIFSYTTYVPHNLNLLNRLINLKAFL